MGYMKDTTAALIIIPLTFTNGEISGLGTPIAFNKAANDGPVFAPGGEADTEHATWDDGMGNTYRVAQGGVTKDLNTGEVVASGDNVDKVKANVVITAAARKSLLTIIRANDPCLVICGAGRDSATKQTVAYDYMIGKIPAELDDSVGSGEIKAYDLEINGGESYQAASAFDLAAFNLAKPASMETPAGTETLPDLDAQGYTDLQAGKIVEVEPA